MISNGVLCDRARSWAALAPDGELSELELKLLGSHLTRCGACSVFAAEVTRLAEELRDAELQPLAQPISVPSWRRRTAYARVRAVGAAAAVALMALGIASRAPLSSSGRESLQLPRVVDFSGGDQAEIQRLEAAQHLVALRTTPARLRPARHFGNQPS